MEAHFFLDREIFERNQEGEVFFHGGEAFEGFLSLFKKVDIFTVEIF